MIDRRDGDPLEFTCAAPTTRVPSIKEAAHVLGASFLADDGDKSKTRMDMANTLLGEYRDCRLLERLVRRLRDSQTVARGPRYDVNFIVATVPDYVDSNSGWMADQGLAAIQSGMTHHG